MEDVVLHCRPGSAAGLGSLLQRTERLLESFPCRTPPAFTPWFPSAADCQRPIRPAKPAPVITSPADVLVSDGRAHAPVAEGPRGAPRSETTATPVDGFCVSESPAHLLPAALPSAPERAVTSPSPERHTGDGGLPAAGSRVRRSWSVFTQKGVLLRSSPSLSKQFQHVVSVHGLHLRQRAKWVIRRHNCGAAGDVEQVWRALSRSARSSRLPTCNANIQRGRAEIWVFCDVLCSEQVGRFLKDELQLSGTIGLSVHRLGDVFSM